MDKRQYDLVIKLMKRRNWDVNHKNELGDTFGHLLALDNDVRSLKVIDQLTKKTNYSPNIKNNSGEKNSRTSVQAKDITNKGGRPALAPEERSQKTQANIDSMS